MRRMLAVTMLGLFACTRVSQAQEKANPGDPEPSCVKVQIRGVLHVKDAAGKIPELETAFARQRQENTWQNYYQNFLSAYPTTGVSIATVQLGAVNLYLGDDPELHELAQELTGKTVDLSGDLRLVSVLPRTVPGMQFVYPGQGQGQRIEWPYPFPPLLYVRVSVLKATGQ
jgi:hypothetical protein